MGGKGSSGGGPTQADINQQAYDAGAQGYKWVDIDDQIPFGHEEALQSWMAGGAAGGGAHSGFHFPEGGGHAGGGSDVSEILAQQQSSYESALQQQQATLAQQEADRRRIEGENRRDSLYSAYMDAAGAATDYVNSEIAREMSNAALIGVDYSLDDEMKSQRINDYFATIWGEGEQSSLEALMGEFGNPKGFGGFSITRGDGTKYAGTEGGEESKAVSGGMRPTLATDEEEAGLGGAANILGV